MKHLIASVSVLTLFLSACASTVGDSPNYADTTSPDAKLFADYLVGSYADQLDDAGARSKYYSRAYERLQDDVTLGRRAITSALTAGDLDEARKLAGDIQTNSPGEPMARALLGAEAFAAGRYDKASSYFADETSDLTVRILMNIMKGWNQAAQGNPDEAKATFEDIGGGGYFDLLGQLQTANLDASLGDMSSAKTAFMLAEASNLSPIETALSHARALSSTGDMDGALTHLETFSLVNGPFETGPVKYYIDTLKLGQPINETLNERQLAARALTEPAFGFFLRNRAPDVAEVFLRFALILDPKHDKAALWLGSVLENQERGDEAMALFKGIDESSPYIVSAKLSQANIHFANDDDDVALALLEKTNAQHTSFVTRESLGRSRLIRENYAEALPIYDALVKSMSEDELKANIETLYYRGICYEREKRWDEAVADFKRVLSLEPDHADALNYLGYTWVDRNENLTEAFDMIRKAVRLQPDSGAIVDSLGWAHYKLGQYSQARVQLEKAVELSPSSATIIDHLGDTYWKLGRYREAGYQWERALEFDPTDEERANIMSKLEGGLNAVSALP